MASPLLALRDVDDVVTAAVLAPALEASAPKPGNVSPLASFDDTAHAHFLASAAALHGPVRRLAGRAAGEPSEAGLGAAVEEAVTEAARWHRGGNTVLGTALLLAPLAAGAARALALGGGDLDGLLAASRELVGASKPEDTAAIYRAIARARPGGLGRAPRWDASRRGAAERVAAEGVTPLAALAEAADRDDVAREWARGFPRSRRCCLLLLEARCGAADAAVIAFLALLSERPDSLIRRKAGEEAAERVTLSSRALTGLEPLSARWRQGVQRLDLELRTERLNPGTTADIVAAGLFLALCCGWRT